MAGGIRSEPTRNVYSVNGVDKLYINQDGSLELVSPAASPTGNKIPTAGQLPFTKEYTSAEQTITSAGLLTLAHGLGVVPKLISLELVCKVADQGYSVGAVVLVSPGSASSSAADNFGYSVGKDATNISIRYGVNPIIILHAVSGLTVQGVNTSWRLVVRAWA